MKTKVLASLIFVPSPTCTRGALYSRLLKPRSRDVSKISLRGIRTKRVSTVLCGTHQRQSDVFCCCCGCSHPLMSADAGLNVCVWLLGRHRRRSHTVHMTQRAASKFEHWEASRQRREDKRENLIIRRKRRRRGQKKKREIARKGLKVGNTERNRERGKEKERTRGLRSLGEASREKYRAARKEDKNERGDQKNFKFLPTDI